MNPTLLARQPARARWLRSNPTHTIDYYGTTLFAADDGLSGIELWKSDGTYTGTVQVKDIRAGAQGSRERRLGRRGM